MSDSDDTANDIQLRWRQLRTFRYAWLLLLLGFVPAIYYTSGLLGSQAFFPVLFVYGASFLYTGYRLDRWECPRCHKPFFRKLGRGSCNPFRRTCANCELARNSGLNEVAGSDLLSSPAQSSPQQQS